MEGQRLSNSGSKIAICISQVSGIVTSMTQPYMSIMCTKLIMSHATQIADIFAVAALRLYDEGLKRQSFMLENICG